MWGNDMADTTTTEKSWAELVNEIEGDKMREKPIAYEFNGGRKIFKSREQFGGVYAESEE
jgi:hypothetical protein